MSPFTVLEATGAVSTNHGAELSIQTPTRARVGLQLVAFVFWPLASVPPDFAADGWTELGQGIGDNYFAVLRRQVTDEEPAFYTFAFTGALSAAGGPCMGVLMLVAGCDDAAGTVDLESRQLLADGPDLIAKYGTLTKYSDAAFSFFYAPVANGFDDTDAKTVIEVHGADTDAFAAPVAGSLLMLFEMPEAAGPIGDRTGTLLGGAPTNATTGQVVLSAQPCEQAPRWDNNDPIAIGLPTVGI